MNILEYLNGKKTAIGAAFLTVAFLFSQVVGIWHITGSWVDPLTQTLGLIGTFFSSTGIVHKMNKGELINQP